MTNFDYTSRDFDTIRAELLSRARTSIPEWTDRNSSDFMNALIDLWAYSADVMHYYIDRAAGEAFLPTATQRESVLAFANLYDYAPAPIRGAQATVSVFNSTAASVTLPAYSQFSGTYNGSTFLFYNSTSYICLPDSTSQITVKEGSYYKNQSMTSSSGSTTSDGSASQRFRLFHKNVDIQSIKVKVNEGVEGSPEEWTRVSYLSTATSSDSVFTTNVAADGTVYVQFGNGVNGRIPPVKLTITVDYAVCTGSLGNVPANTIRAIQASLTGLRVTSSSAAVGGIDPEDINTMKLSIPKSLRTQGRAVTLTDFADIALSVPGVFKSVAKYEPGAGTAGSVSIYVAPYSGTYLTDGPGVTTLTVTQDTRVAVYNEVVPRMMLGVGTVSIPQTVTLTPIYVSMDVYVKDNYVQSLVQSAVEAAVDTLFSFEKVSFGQIMTIGEVYRKVLSVDGVDYAVITDFNTTGTGNGLQSNGRIVIDPYRLAKKGVVVVTTFNGVTPPV